MRPAYGTSAPLVSLVGPPTIALIAKGSHNRCARLPVVRATECKTGAFYLLSSLACTRLHPWKAVAPTARKHSVSPMPTTRLTSNVVVIGVECFVQQPGSPAELRATLGALRSSRSQAVEPWRAHNIYLVYNHKPYLSMRGPSHYFLSF